MALTTLIAPKSDWEFLTLSSNQAAPQEWNTTYGDWSISGAPFGNHYGTWGGNDDFYARTYWAADGGDGDDLLVRATVDLTGVDLSTLKYYVGVDNGAKLYVNGNLVMNRNDGGYGYRWEYQGDILSQHLVAGTNIIALALEDHGGLTAFDMQLTGDKNETPVPIQDRYSVVAEANNILITYSTPIQMLGTEFDTESIKIFVDGEQRSVASYSIELPPINRVSNTSLNTLKLSLHGRTLNSASRISIEFNQPSGGSSAGYVASALPLTPNLLFLNGLTVVDHLLTASSVDNRGLALAYNEVSLTGNERIDGIGNIYDNLITGNEANNLLDGREGADILVGKGGNDIYIVDNLGDDVFEAPNQGVDTVVSRISYTLPSNVEVLDLDGANLGLVNRNSHQESRNINGTGNNLDNTIYGNKFDNILDGGLGADTLIGGYGADTYIVDNINDTVIESGSWREVDTVVASVSRTLEVGVENLQLTGTNALNGTGNRLNNVITGNSSSNILDGISGKDVLTGMGGSDTFVLSKVVGRNNFTTITDMVVGRGGDKVSISRERLGIVAGSSRPITFRSVNNSRDLVSSHNSNIMFIYDTQSGDLLYNQNGIQRGLGSGGVIANFVNTPILTFNDFLFI